MKHFALRFVVASLTFMSGVAASNMLVSSPSPTTRSVLLNPPVYQQSHCSKYRRSTAPTYRTLVLEDQRTLKGDRDMREQFVPPPPPAPPSPPVARTR